MNVEEQEARRILRRAKGMVAQNAEPFLRRGVERFPENVFLRAYLASVLLALNHPDQALIEADEVVRRAPEDVVGWGLKAQMLLALGQPNDALDAINEKLRLDPGDAIGWGLKTQALLAMNQPGHALNAVNEKLRLSPDDAIGWGLKAQTFLALGQSKSALAAIEQKLRRTPNDIVGWGLKAQALLAHGEPEAALKVINATQDREPNNLVSLGLLAQAMLALGRPVEALQATDKILERTPDSLFGRGLQASIYLKTGDYAKADSILATLKNSHTKLARDSALFVSAVSALKQGDLERAQESLTQLQVQGFDVRGCRLWKQTVEAGMGSPERYNDVLNLALQSRAISTAEYEELVPQVVSASPAPKEFVDSRWLDLQLQEQLAGMQFGEVARSKMFTTELFPTPIDRTAFDVSISRQQLHNRGRE